MNNNFVKQIIFSDEAYIYLSGFVNKQNCRIWENKISEIMQEREVHPLRKTVWCHVWTGRPFFFKTDEETTVRLLLSDNGTETRYLRSCGRTCRIGD